MEGRDAAGAGVFPVPTGFSVADPLRSLPAPKSTLMCTFIRLAASDHAL